MNKITKLILRLIKETKKYNQYINDEKFNRQFNNIAISWVTTYRDLKLEKLYYMLDNEIDIQKYRDYANFRNIIIYNIKDINKLFNYFDNNGIIWGSGNKCTDYMPQGFNPISKDSYLKLYSDDNRICYGNGLISTYGTNEITLTDEEFYVYYEKYKKRINDNFERFLKK